MAFSIVMLVGLVALASLLGFIGGLVIDMILEHDSAINATFLAVALPIVALIVVGISATRQCNKTDNAIETRYAAALQDEAKLEFFEAHKPELVMFREMFIDKLEKFSAEEKCKVFDYVISHAVASGKGKVPKSKEEQVILEDTLAFTRAAYENSENYKKFLSIAGKFTDASFEEKGKMKLSYVEFRKKPDCDCGKCGTNVTTTFTLDLL